MQSRQWLSTLKLYGLVFLAVVALMGLLYWIYSGGTE
jgi:hypothetical protein